MSLTPPVAKLNSSFYFWGLCFLLIPPTFVLLCTFKKHFFTLRKYIQLFLVNDPFYLLLVSSQSDFNRFFYNFLFPNDKTKPQIFKEHQIM